MVKQGIDELGGKMKTDMAMILSDQKVTAEKMVQVDRFMDRVRASNTYGEPITNFNEDSATKTEMQEFVK